MDNHDLDLKDIPECAKCKEYVAEVEILEIASLLMAFIGLSIGILVGLFVGKRLLSK